MAVDLFSLRMNMEVTGAQQATAALQSVNTVGATTAAGLNSVSNQFVAMRSTAQAATATVHPMAAAMATATTGSLAWAAGMRNLQTQQAAATRQTAAFATVKTDLLGVLNSGFFRFFAVAGAIDMMRRSYNAATSAADAYAISNIKLEGAAKLFGLSLGSLQAMSSRAQVDFRLSARLANDLSSEVAKFAAKAGDVNKAEAAMRAFLDLGAAQGLTAEQTLVAIRQAILGIDEGTDKLFQKNPSAIWKEWADAHGTVIGKMSDQEKALAVMDAAFEKGALVRGAYARFLETTPGKQAQLNVAMENFAIAIGRVFNPLRDLMASVATPFLNWLGDIIERMQRLNAPGASLGGLAANLGRAIGGAGKEFAGDPGGAVDRSTNPALAALGPLPAPPKADPEADAARRAAAAAAEKARRERVLGVLDASPADRLDFQGFPSRIATRNDRINISGALEGRGTPGGDSAWDEFEAEQRRNARKVNRSFANLGGDMGMAVANGFGAALAAGIQGKNPFTAFGKAVLGGLGSIFTQMGSELIAYGVIMLNLLPFLSNPFTSGPAAIAAGAALVALGSALGGIATGPGGGSGGRGGSGGHEDKVTRISLTSDGLGGRNAPGRDTEKFTILGVDSPKGQRVLATAMKGAKRRNMGG
jgi:hypothetical protein